jgi:hypothetical protein
VAIGTEVFVENPAVFINLALAGKQHNRQKSKEDYCLLE